MRKFSLVPTYLRERHTYSFSMPVTKVSVERVADESKFLRFRLSRPKFQIFNCIWNLQNLDPRSIAFVDADPNSDISDPHPSFI